MTQGRTLLKPSFKREVKATGAKFTIGRPGPRCQPINLRLTLRRRTESHDLADGRFEGQLNPLRLFLPLLA